MPRPRLKSRLWWAACFALVAGLVGYLYWMPPMVPAMAAPSPTRLAEQAQRAYRQQHAMRAASAPGEWQLAALDSQSGERLRYLGRFASPLPVTDAQGGQWLLGSFSANTEASANAGEDSFATPGVSRLLLWQLQGGRYVLRSERQRQSGSQGMAPAVRMLQLGAHAWGWVVESRYLHMGYQWAQAEFFLAAGGAILPMGQLVTRADNRGACVDGAVECAPPTDLQAQWRLVARPGLPFYPLEVEWSGMLNGQRIARHLSLLPERHSRRYPFPEALNVSF
ncbi:MAG TPA: hypothetical protein VJ642_05545 [Chromobacteriaceae bacterium]|nr:hypothetical protein [Chromobacteriaceae bacterium]